jgi:putative tryptophan/tyrosine transport system substrate-binding protein
MRRREFIAGLGSAVALPAVPRAQQSERMRRIGVLMAFNDSDPEGKAWLSKFTLEL